MPKVAVVVGVNRTGGLPPLKDAAAGAIRVADWLRAEGFEVHLLTDDAGPVRVAQLFERIEAVCRAGIYDQLLVYFSGHGYLNDGAEHWLLSDAPVNANEAVNLEENVYLARDCGIPNIVFVSDACRSTPQSLRADRVRGSLVFPNVGASRGHRAEVDRLFACMPGDPAYEVPVDKSSGSYRALYTACLSKAFVDTAEAYCRDVGGIKVLSNRSLKRLIPNLVEAAASEASVTLFQKPDSIVESADDFYIARVTRTLGPPQADASRIDGGEARQSPPLRLPPIFGGWFGDRLGGYFGGKAGGRFGHLGRRDVPATPAAAPAAGDVSLREHADILVGEMLGTTTFRGGPPDPDVRLGAAIRTASRLPGLDGVERGRGIAVRGAAIAEVHGIGCEAYLVEAGGKGMDGWVRVEPGQNSEVSFPDSVVVRLGDGSGGVLAVPDGFVCAVGVEADGGGSARTDGIAQVAYTPLRTNACFNDFLERRDEIERARALVAGLARKGVFKVERWQAAVLREKVAIRSTVDPTLGLFAAYAYADIGLSDEVEALASRFPDGFGGRMPYDLALLARSEPRIDGRSMTPLCPMLSRGWQLLRVFGAKLAPHVEEAGMYRRATLWTTFERHGLDILLAGEKDP